MSLHSFLYRGAAPAPPARITIRRRLLGRGSRLRTVGLAAGLLGLGLSLGQSAHAGTVTWDGVPADWFAAPSHWSNGTAPLSTDDAQNNTVAAMTLGQSTTVNSFFSNGAFSLLGGAFTGNKAAAASTIQVNNVFTLNGGQVNNFTINQGTGGSVVVTGSGGNGLINSVVNANLDLATNANAFLRFQGTDTVNGTINLATTSNGLDIYTTNDNLILNGSLTGFGTIFEQGAGSILTNNGLVNANVSGKTLAQTNSNFVNSGTAQAMNGGILSLNNTLTNNGTLAASGAGSVVSLTGTLASSASSTLSATNGGQIQVNGVALGGTLNGVGATSLIFNGSGNNGFNNTVANINLDLATNANAFLRFQGTDTVNGTISLGTTSNGLDIYTTGDNLILSGTGSLVGFGNISEQGSGSILTNNGLINATGGALTQTNSNFINNGTAEATNGATLALNNTLTNNGKLIADGAGSTLTLVGTLASSASSTLSATNGGQIQVNGVALGGTLNGVGATSLIFNGSGNNGFNNTVANINLDLATNANAFLRFQGTDTVNGAITLATTSNGLDIYTTNDNLVLGGTASLTGFGTIFEQGSGSILTSSATINANVSGKTLAQTNSNFVNYATAEATGGGILSLNNNITNNGLLGASGGGILTIAGTLTSSAGSTINGVGGTVDINGVALRGTINGMGATSLIFNGSSSNGLLSTTVNANLDLATNANAFLLFQGTDTVNGAISLATTSNGLDIYTTNDNLILNGSLTGFGNIFEQGSGSILTNNGTINANATGGALTQTNTNFVNNGTAKATNGATLALNNNIANSAGATIAAVGAGSLVTLAGTFTGTGNNLITASGGGQVQVNGVALRGTINTDAGTSLVVNNSGSNGLLNTTVNGNLSLTKDSSLLFQGTDTVNGTISLATTSNGLDIYTTNDNLVIGSTGKLVGYGTTFEQGTGSILTNNGLVSANVAGQTLNISNTNFTNTGTAQATNGATLNVTSANATNSGTVFTDVGGTANFSNGLTQTAGLTRVFGTLNTSEAVQGGVLGGSGKIFGNVTNTGGTVESVNYNTPAGTSSLVINGDFTQSGTGALDVFFGNNFHTLLTVTGQTTLGGTLGVFDLDSNPAAGLAAVGSKFTFLDYSNTLNATGSAGGFTQYFSNEVPDGNNSGLITGQNGFVYELLNDTANKQLDLQVVTAGSPVPEASTTVSFGLLLALGLGGVVVAARRKKSV